MSLEQWQIALRKQAAENETFGISEILDTDETGCYNVNNPKTKQNYKVIYRGLNSSWNYCSCLDFKSNQLGTCKHLEAVKSWLAANQKQISTELPSYTSVYLSYKGVRQVCIRIGSEKKKEFESLASLYFDSSNILKPESIDSFPAFLNEARKISNTFQCYNDALQFVIDIKDRKTRAQLVVDKCTDNAIDGLLHTSLYPYQKDGVRFAVRAGKCIIADEMGLGKTIQAIACAEFYKKEGLVSSVLVLCPTTLKYQWQKEIERFTDSTVTVIEGNLVQRRRQYKSSDYYKIVSYNSLCNDVKNMGSLHTDMLIMDEAQRLKNWNTQIAKAARRVDSDYCIVLSGTPLENKLQELYSIVQFADQFCLGPYYKFIDYTTIFSSNGQILGYKNLNSIGKLLSNLLIRRRKKDVALQLPNRTDKNLFVPMTKEQRDLHDEYQSYVAQIVYKWSKTHYLSDKDRKRLLLLLSEMRMVCDSTYIIDQNTRHDIKVEELMNIIDDMIETGDEKMVVFSQWERMTRLICEELDKHGIHYVNLNGNIPAFNRKELMDEFMENPLCRVFVSTDTGSVGINLQAASIVVNLDLPWNPAVLEQRISRIYRIGQQRNIQVINFISERSIEERMMSTLTFKSGLSEGILDEGNDVVFMDKNKFDKLMNAVIDVISDNETETVIPIAPLEETESKFRPAPKVNTEVIQQTINFDEELYPEEKVEESPQAVIQKGVSFFSSLSSILSSPQKLENLVDSIVKEDKESGKMMVQIPVTDKQSVLSFLKLLGRLLGNDNK